MIKRETTKLLMSYMIEPIARLCESYIIDRSPDTGRMFAAGHWELSRDLLNQNNKDTCLYAACASGEYEMINLALTMKPPDYIFAIEGAASSNNVEIARYVINLSGSTRVTYDAIKNAAESGNVEMCKYLLQIGYRNSLCFMPEGLNAASGPEWLSIINIACEHGVFDANAAAFYAGIANSPERIIRFIRNRKNVNCAFEGACVGGHLDLIKNIMEMYPDTVLRDKYVGLSGSVEILSFLTTKGYVPSEDTMFIACRDNHHDLCEHLSTVYELGCKLCDTPEIHIRKMHNLREYKRHRNNPGDFILIPTLMPI